MDSKKAAKAEQVAVEKVAREAKKAAKAKQVAVEKAKKKAAREAKKAAKAKQVAEEKAEKKAAREAKKAAKAKQVAEEKAEKKAAREAKKAAKAAAREAAKLQRSNTNSDTAKSGFKAEKIFRTSPIIKTYLEKYFKKSIKNIEKAPHGEKSDNIINFEDESKCNIQNKKILNLGGRGDSFDRRHIANTFNNRFIRKSLTLLTLSRPTKRSTYMTEAQKKDFVLLCNNNLEDIKQYIKKTLIGEKNKNDYWCIMKTDKKFLKIDLYIINSETFYKFIEKSISINIILKNNGTCLHLSKYIALQRKGGGNTDRAPNHIQAKLKITQDLLDIFERIL